VSAGEARTERAGGAAGCTAGITIVRGEPNSEETAAVVAVALAFARARAVAGANAGPARPAAWYRPRPAPAWAAAWAGLAPGAWRTDLS
jgi:hypothetical protein